jgi:hypothetical protein
MRAAMQVVFAFALFIGAMLALNRIEFGRFD